MATLINFTDLDTNDVFRFPKGLKPYIYIGEIDGLFYYRMQHDSKNNNYSVKVDSPAYNGNVYLVSKLLTKPTMKFKYKRG